MDAPQKPSFERQESLGYLVNRLARLFSRALEKRLAAHGVALGPFPILLLLWEQEGLTQTEIARRLDFEQPTISNTLKRMERDGLIEFAPDPTSRKRILVRLTEKAKALRLALTGEAEAVNQAASAKMSTRKSASSSICSQP
ncbi:MarR family winged helix-turn-helix transcriptional regulator [Rhodoblastus sp.]|uniref:MarR family winged helix-turn-helix transcriptional regulator n=1 Tax=Rhodoblastus sp. TaxID=1962975 RepID=UPI003F99C4B4